jgi:FAD binding domain-containing protein
MSAYQTRLSSPSRLTSAPPGRVVLPEHVGFNEARRAWNLAIDQRPAAVAFPESLQHVAAVVLFAREFGLRVAAQGTGHSAAPLGSLDDTILLKTDRMRGVSIDPARRTARVRAGTVWLEVVEAAARHGLAALAGSSPDVGVVGYTLGGGLSALGRRYGLAANHVSAIELVTADGRLVRADPENEPDLFWALRGGGGSFGVVTAIEFKLFSITQAYAGILWYPIDRDLEVLHAWRELTQSDLPDELTTVGRFLNLPPIPEIPEPVRGQSFAIIEVYHLDDPVQADDLLAPLRALGPLSDTIATSGCRRSAICAWSPSNQFRPSATGSWSTIFPRTRSTPSSKWPARTPSSRSCRSSYATSAASCAASDASMVRSPQSKRTTPWAPSGWCPRPSSRRRRGLKWRPSRQHSRPGRRDTCTWASPTRSKTRPRFGPIRPTAGCAASRPPSIPTTSSAQTTPCRSLERPQDVAYINGPRIIPSC